MAKVSATIRAPTPIIGNIGSREGLTANIGNVRGAGGSSDYNRLRNKPTLNGVEIAGNKTSEDYGIDCLIPQGGNIGDLVCKTGGDTVGWVTPASNAEEDNTRPITAAAVYTEIGNINALLATI